MTEDGQTVRLRDELVNTYRPIVNGAMLVGVAYFTFNASKRLFYSDGAEQWVMGSLAVALAAASALLWAWTRNPRTAFELEMCSAIGCTGLLGNTVLHMLIEFEQENLVYYGMMMPLFAMLTPRVTIALFWTLLCTTCLLGFVAYHLPAMFYDYVSVAIACFAGAMGAVCLIRRALLNAVAARIDADRKHREALRLSSHDPLTGLPNRRSFFEAFHARRSTLEEKGRKFLLILLDLDGFKPVNDVHGHAAGDALLRALSDRLRKITPPHTLAARLGGDEFAILADYPSRSWEVRALAARITDALSLPYSHQGGELRISCSAGVYVCGRTDLSAGEMLERADHALYTAKVERRGEAVLFAETHETDLANAQHVDHALRQADLDTELSLVFQPQLDLESGTVSGFEALARWRSPAIGPVSPDVFIRAAERTNQMRRVTDTLLGKALDALKTIPEPLNLAVNLSAHDLMQDGGARNLIDRIRQSGVDPSRLEFEITETAMLTDHSLATQALSELHAVGVSIALDDFGCGYSNFAYLQKLHIQKLKIDRSFVQPLLGEPSAAKILQTLISLSRSLGLVCVVEGIEKPEQMARIEAFGARYIQGFLLARPMPERDIPDFLEQAPAWLADIRRNYGETAEAWTQLSAVRP